MPNDQKNTEGENEDEFGNIGNKLRQGLQGRVNGRRTQTAMSGSKRNRVKENSGCVYFILQNQ